MFIHEHYNKLDNTHLSGNLFLWTVIFILYYNFIYYMRKENVMSIFNFLMKRQSRSIMFIEEKMLLYNKVSIIDIIICITYIEILLF